MTNALQQQWSAAQQLLEQKQWRAARAGFLKVLDLQPSHAPSLLQLSYIESLIGSYRMAHGLALQAFRACPSNDKTVAELIVRLRTFNEAEAIDVCSRRLPLLREVDIRLLLSFAAQFSYLNQQMRAMEFLDEAKRGDPDFPPTLVARGQVLTYLGRFEEAEKDLQRCIYRAPELAQAHWLLSRLKKATASANHIDQIRSSLRRFRHTGDAEALLEYALHKEFDDLEDYSEAWAALERACMAKRRTLRYSIDETRTLFAKLRGKALASAAASQSGAPTRTAVFIVGMHRSGTTLLEHLLGRHEQVSALGELYDFTSQMRAATDHHCAGVIDPIIVERADASMMAGVGEGYLASVAWRLGGESHFSDKLPSNFLNLGFICNALPNARIIHMVRDPMETAFSNLRELFSGANPYSYDQRELADYYLHYRDLMHHWHQHFPGRILDVDYGELTRNPDATLQRVAQFCGLPPLFSGASSEGVATASAVQVREGVQVRRVPKWQPYAEHLQVLQERLAAPQGPQPR